MIELVARPLADAFMQVGVFVALMIGLFGYLQYRTGDRLTRFLAARWRSAPLFGALLGVTPGCGGAILVMPLYLRGTVSFGTVVAALVATMGDSSFVLIATDPGLALAVHGILFVAGVVSGYATDALGIAPRVRSDAGGVAAVGRSVGSAEAFPPTRVGVPTMPVRLGAAPALFWWLSGLGLAVAVPVVFQLTGDGALTRLLGGVDPYLVVGVAGTASAVAVFVRARCRLCDDTVESMAEKRSSFQAMLRHGARETAFVTVWVAIAFLVTTWVVDLGGIDIAAFVTAAGLTGVLVGAAIGLVPGCAPQIVLTGLYATGAMPFATLVANALSQDGDALFPMLMMDRRAAALASVVTTAPALLVGAAFLSAGF